MNSGIDLGRRLTKPVLFTNGAHGDHLTNFFSSQLKCDEKLILLSSKFKQTDRYKVLHMAQQLCSRVMCKNSRDILATNGITVKLQIEFEL